MLLAASEVGGLRPPGRRMHVAVLAAFPPRLRGSQFDAQALAAGDQPDIVGPHQVAHRFIERTPESAQPLEQAVEQRREPLWCPLARQGCKDLALAH